MILDIQDDRLILRASPRYKDLIAQVPGMNYNSKLDAWTAPLAWSIAIACRGILGNDMQTTAAVVEWAENEKLRVQWAEAFRSGLWLHPALDSNLGLYPFQLTGVTFLSMVERVLLADEMGTGKTVQAAVAYQIIRDMAVAGTRPPSGPLLVVCTNSMKGTWVKALNDWAGIDAVATGKDKKSRDRAFKAIRDHTAQALVINWEALRLHSRIAGYGSISLTDEEKKPKELNELGFQTIIADEVHKAKEPTTKQTRALWAIGETATYRWALTGTPVDGKAEDLWAIMHFVEPDEWPSKSRWIDRYAIKGYNAFGGMETYGFNPINQAELKAIMNPRFLRRTKSEVLPQLPPKIPATRWVEMDTKQAKPYKTMAKELIAMIGDDVLVAPSDLVKNARLSQMACGTPVLAEESIIDPETGEPTTRVIVESLTMPSCKVDAMMDILEESGDQAVVFGAESRKLLELCARELDKAKIPYVLITGKQTAAERTVNVEMFQQGGVRCALVSLGAGAEGITLTRARILVFLQRSWSPTKNNQFEDRIHRIGQDADSVEIIDVVTEGTIEIDKFDVVASKEEVAQQVVNDPDWVKKALSR